MIEENNNLNVCFATPPPSRHLSKEEPIKRHKVINTTQL